MTDTNLVLEGRKSVNYSILKTQSDSELQVTTEVGYFIRLKKIKRLTYHFSTCILKIAGYKVIN